jgi:hypothetical protein
VRANALNTQAAPNPVRRAGSNRAVEMSDEVRWRPSKRKLPEKSSVAQSLDVNV